MRRYALSLALVLLASPAGAEMLLTTVAGSFENIDSDQPTTRFQLAVDGCNRCFSKTVPYADGATSWTTGLDGLNAFLATPLSELFAWNIIHPAVQSHSVDAEIEFLIAGLWQPATWASDPLQFYASSTPSVDAFQAVSRVELALSNLVIDPIEYGGGDFFYRHSVDFQLRLFAAAPEPSLMALLCPLLLGCVSRRRSAVE